MAQENLDLQSHATRGLPEPISPAEHTRERSRANVERQIEEIPPKEPHRLCDLQVAESQGERINAPWPRWRVDINVPDSRCSKCDESKPACGNCTKHNVVCDFLKPTPPAPGSSPGPPGGLDMQSLELLHNFTTRTFATMSDSIIIRDFYRQSAVQLGLRCDYIMRTVLAISALHLAYHRPEMRDHYHSLAMTHHQVASRDASETRHPPPQEVPDDS